MALSDFDGFASNLTLTPHGWWAPPSGRAPISYPDQGNSLCFGVEESSFWFQHRNRCIVAALSAFPPPGAIFDVGGGNGCVAAAIQRAAYEVVLVEPGLEGVQNAVRRGLKHVAHATLEDLGMKPGIMPAVGLFDVVEHIPGYQGFMQSVHRLLIPGGRAYITVPAYQWLWSDEDVESGHVRRFTLRTLRRLLEDSGFEVEFGTYLFSFLPIPMFLQRVIPYRLGFARSRITVDAMRSDHAPANKAVRRFLDLLTRRELSRISARRPIRWGGSCFVVAGKREGA